MIRWFLMTKPVIALAGLGVSLRKRQIDIVLDEMKRLNGCDLPDTKLLSRLADDLMEGDPD